MSIRPVALVETPSPTNDKPISGTRARRFSYVGTVPKGSIYVEREADRILPNALASGEFCHVFGPRQIGKSSLRSRVTQNLKSRGIRCAAIDMEVLGSSAKQDQWFYALVELIADKLQLPDPHDFWQQHPHVSPARRWGLYLRHIVQKEIVEQRCVLLLDEIEAVRLVSFPSDDFFLILRELFEARSEEPYLERLAICLMGVTVPDDLLKEKRSTPYNISRRVHLDDFTRTEMDGLAVGLDDLGASTVVLLDAIHAWTDGHPYMTMRTCEAVYQHGPMEKGQEQAVVNAVVQDLFLAHAMDDANLRHASDRFTHSVFDKADLPLMEKVLLLRRLLDGERVPADLESPVQMELHLCGMIKGFSDNEGEWVKTRNRIFASVFDAQWLQSRGDRRYLGGALWKWRESGKNKDYLLRGEALVEALARDARLWTDDEREFLIEGLKEQIEFASSNLELLKFGHDVSGKQTNQIATLVLGNVRNFKSMHKIMRIFAYFSIAYGALQFAITYTSQAGSTVRFANWTVSVLQIILGIVLVVRLPSLVKGLTEIIPDAERLKEESASDSQVSLARMQQIETLEKTLDPLRAHLARLSSPNPPRS